MDIGHDWTDREIEKLEKRFSRMYSQASREMSEKLDELMREYDEGLVEWKAKLAKGASHDDYEEWLSRMSHDRNFVGGMADTLAASAARADRMAIETINDALPRVYAENANMAAYAIEDKLGWDTHSFNLVDESTVRKLMTMPDNGQILKEVTTDKSIINPPLVTMRKLNFDEAKDVRWNRQKFTSAITQSILQGESIPNTAKRLKQVLNMGKGMATRAARTAMTSAENAGRVDSYKRAENIGIKLEQQWMATLDGRTRHSHRLLDGEHVPVGEMFSNGLEYPGDPKGRPEEVWNCRCTLVAWFPDIEQEDPERWSKLPEGMTYDEWKHEKLVEASRQEQAGVVNGKNILGTWQRRPDQYDFEIEDVIAAQGFDGKPRVVSADEFDEAVKAANNGNGFIAQRTYSAPDQETLDAYRQQLYDGKWYVDCSTGGAQYGQGMYCAADYTGTLSDGIKEEMSHYIELNNDRNYEKIRDSLDEARKEKVFHMLEEEADRFRFDGYTQEELRSILVRESGSMAYAGDSQDAMLSLAKAAEKRNEDSYDKVVSEMLGKYDKVSIDRVRAMTPSAYADYAGISLDANTYIETMTLDPSAKIVSFGDLSSSRDGRYRAVIGAMDVPDDEKAYLRYISGVPTGSDTRRAKALQKANPERAQELYQIGGDVTKQVIAIQDMDPGAYAAALGYDAINAEGHGASGSYTVILNRTKLIIKEP